jgi:hypothetical protein
VAWWMSRGAATDGALTVLVHWVGGERNIYCVDKRAAGSAEQKRRDQPGSGRGADRIQFRRPFHPDCEDGAVAHLEFSATPLLAQNLISQPTLVISQLHDHAFKPGDIYIKLIT